MLCVLFAILPQLAIADETPTIREHPAPKTMLFLGNRFVYYNNSLHNHTRKLVQSVYEAEAKTFFFKSMTISGSYLADHALGAKGMIPSIHTKRKSGLGNWSSCKVRAESPSTRKSQSNSKPRHSNSIR